MDEGGLKASALSSMNLCMKEKNQAVKGDAPGKFKIPLESGEECGPRSSLPHSLPRRPAQPGVPSPALRAPGSQWGCFVPPHVALAQPPWL